MLIEDEIKRLCDQGRLFAVEPLEWRENQEREVYVSPDINEFLTKTSSDPAVNADRRKLQRLFDRFISGQEITVAFRQSIKRSNMKRLYPPSAEVWEFKVRTRPQLRVFGRFAGKDLFLAITGPVDRPNCDHNVEIVRCQEEWAALLPKHSPIYGSTINDYISAKAISL
jgi:hypothetical protein